MTEPTPTGQEKQSCLELLRLELGKPGNFVELLWGGTPILWPNPSTLRDALGTHTDVTYKALLLDMGEDEDSQKERALCIFYLRILEEENTADEMEVLEGRAIIASDLAPQFGQVTLTSGAEPDAGVLSREESLNILCQEIDRVISGVELQRREKESNLRKIASESLRKLNEQSFWDMKVWTTTRQDLQYISEMKTRLSIGDLEDLPQGASQEVSLMLSALRAARDRLQQPGAEDGPPLRGGSEAKSVFSTGTLEAGKARMETLKETVANCEAFLLTEESQGQDFALLKKLELLKGNVGSTVNQMEKSQRKGLQLAPGEVEEVDGWLSRGYKCTQEIMKRESKCSAIPPPTQGNFNSSTATKLKFKDIIPARFGKNPRDYLSWKVQTKGFISSFKMSGELAAIWLLEHCLESTISIDLKKIYTGRMNSVDEVFRILDQDYVNPSRDFDDFTSQVARLPVCTDTSHP